MSGATLPVVLRAEPQDRASAVRYFLQKNPRMLVGVVLLAILLFVAAFAPLVAPYDPIKVSIADQLEPPSLDHLLGTDDLGRKLHRHRARLFEISRLYDWRCCQLLFQPAA